MSSDQPYISEIKMFGFAFAPRGWALCNGQLLPIGQNQALFSLLGTTYGGDGVQNFALPDLRSRVPLHFGQGPGLSSYALGQRAGEERHVLTTNEIPPHTHTLSANTTVDATTNNALPAAGNTLGKSVGTRTSGTNFTVNMYNGALDSPTTLSSQSISTVGGQPHENRQPYMTVNFCIAVQGIFPSRN